MACPSQGTDSEWLVLTNDDWDEIQHFETTKGSLSISLVGVTNPLWKIWQKERIEKEELPSHIKKDPYPLVPKPIIYHHWERKKHQNKRYSLGAPDMNQETSIIQYTSMKMWRKGCQNYQKMFQFMLHWRRMNFDCCKFWVGYNLELLYFKTFYLISVTFTSWLIMVIKYECYNSWNAFKCFIFEAI